MALIKQRPSKLIVVRCIVIFLAFLKCLALLNLVNCLLLLLFLLILGRSLLGVGRLPS